MRSSPCLRPLTQVRKTTYVNSGIASLAAHFNDSPNVGRTNATGGSTSIPSSPSDHAPS
jgi:hypothetical protein